MSDTRTPPTPATPPTGDAPDPLTYDGPVGPTNGDRGMSEQTEEVVAVDDLRPSMSATDDERIIVRDLNIYYGDFLAVQGVDMDIEPRSVTALIGPSGCGKSTFLRSLNRMHEVIPGCKITGSVHLDGDPIYGPGIDAV